MKTTKQTICIEFGTYRAWVRVNGDGIPEHVEHMAQPRVLPLEDGEEEVLSEIPVAAIMQLADAIAKITRGYNTSYSRKFWCCDHGMWEGSKFDDCPVCNKEARAAREASYEHEPASEEASA